MNPDTADYINDREETVATKAKERLDQLTLDILEAPGLLDEAMGEWLNQNHGDDYFKILANVCESPADETFFYELRGYILGVAKWYAIRVIAAQDKIEQKYPIKRQAE